MQMNCLICKTGTMRADTETYFDRVKGGYVIIENVPCYKCNQCGEVVYSASVMERIDDLLEQAEKVASKICILDYASAA